MAASDEGQHEHEIVEAARKAVLKELQRTAGSGSLVNKPIDLLRLAEAYAWLSAPAVPHGGGSVPSS